MLDRSRLIITNAHVRARTFDTHSGQVTALTVLPDGQRALSGSGDGTLAIWDLTTGTVLQTFDGQSGGVNAVTLLPDGARALSGSSRGRLTLWDLAAGEVLRIFEHQSLHRRLARTLNGSIITPCHKPQHRGTYLRPRNRFWRS